MTLIRFVFHTCNLQVSFSGRSPLHTPAPIPISLEKDGADTKNITDFSCCKDTTTTPIGSLSHNSILSTPNAPSYGLTPGLISSSNQTISKMYPYGNGSVNAHKIYPYNNNCSMNTHRMPASSVAFPAGYALVPPAPINPFPVTPGRNPGSSIISAAGSQMNVLMRIFPEQKPQLLQSVLGELQACL